MPFTDKLKSGYGDLKAQLKGNVTPTPQRTQS